MLFLYILIFIISSIFLAVSGKLLVDSLSKIAKFLGWKEFVVAFFLVAISVSIPNFLVGIISALKGVPELSFGDVIGGNVVAMTLLVAISALLSRAGLSAPSRTVQGSSIFTIFIAILPLILGLDKELERSDGIILLLTFFAYVFWLFIKKERFTKVYNHILEPMNLKFLLKNLTIFLISIFVLLASANGVVKSALFFGDFFKVHLTLVGILIVSLGNNIPELAFIFQAAKKSQDWLLLGDLMGGVIITSTLVLGMVSLISPIKIINIPTTLVARFFLIFSALFFFITVRTDRKITKKEAIFLLSIYLIFLLIEVFLK